MQLIISCCSVSYLRRTKKLRCSLPLNFAVGLFLRRESYENSSHLIVCIDKKMVKMHKLSIFNFAILFRTSHQKLTIMFCSIGLCIHHHYIKFYCGCMTSIRVGRHLYKAMYVIYHVYLFTFSAAQTICENIVHFYRSKYMYNY